MSRAASSTRFSKPQKAGLIESFSFSSNPAITLTITIKSTRGIWLRLFQVAAVVPTAILQMAVRDDGRYHLSIQKIKDTCLIQGGNLATVVSSS